MLGPAVLHHVEATSLACIVFTYLTSSLTHWRAQRLQFDRLPWLALAVSLGSISAVWLANWVPTKWLKRGFGLIALSTCLSLLHPKKQAPAKPVPPRNELLGAGAFVGHVLTLLGVSGGAMTVPYLLRRGVDMCQAVVVSSAVAIPTSLIGAVCLALTGPNGPQNWGYVHWPAFLGISLVSIVFANWGAGPSQRMDKHKLQMSFAVFLAMVAAYMLRF